MVCREVADYMREKESEGATCVLVAVAQSVVGAFTIKDPLKPEVRVLLPSYQVVRAIQPAVVEGPGICRGPRDLAEMCTSSPSWFSVVP